MGKLSSKFRRSKPNQAKSSQAKTKTIRQNEGILLQQQNVVRVKVPRDAEGMQVTRQRRNEASGVHRGHFHDNQSHI